MNTGEAAVEVLDILNHMNKDDVKKIPQSFISFLRDISAKEYRPQFNHSEKISEFDVKKQTKELLGFIYITWWANEEERKEFQNAIQSEDRKVNSLNYNIADILKNRKNVFKESAKETSIINYKEDGKIKRFFKKVLKLFGKKAEDLDNN